LLSRRLFRAGDRVLDVGSRHGQHHVEVHGIHGHHV
jgi:hypothetical protein